MRAPLRLLPFLLFTAFVIAAMAWFQTDWSGLIIVFSFAGVGMFLLWQRPREPVAWLLVAVSVAFISVGSSVPGDTSQIVNGRGSAMITFLAWFNSWGSAFFFGCFVALAAIFPNGRFPTGRLGQLARIAVGVPIVFGVALAFTPDLTITFLDGSSGTIHNPVGLAAGWPGWGVIGVGVYLAVLGALAVAIGTLVARFRRARGAERAQSKWLLAALAATLGTVIFAFAMILFVDPVGTWMWIPAVIAYPIIPIAIGISVLRYRLYEIDRIVSRTIAYASVTGVLGVTFVALALVLQAILARFTQGQTIATAASTLAVFALLQPVLRRIRRVVDRRFDRARYDAEQTSAAFGDRLRVGFDPGLVATDLADTTSAILAPASVGIWMRSRSGR